MAEGSKASLERLKFSNFKLKTLLNVTRSIVANLPVQQLLSDFQQLLEQQLNIGKIVIYIYQEPDWRVILKSGVSEQEYSPIDPVRDLAPISDISVAYSMNVTAFKGFDFIIPIFKDEKPLAYVLIGDFDDQEEGISPSIKHLQFIQTLSNIIMVSIENHRLMEENMQQERLKKEMEVAAQMQNMLIPRGDIFAHDSNINVRSFYMPHFQVGGDYYDFDYLSKNEMFFCIADVSGKGMSAAIMMSNFQASLKALFVPDMDLPTLVRRLNSIVVRNSNGDRFITLFIGRYNFDSHELKYVNAGHNAPLLYNRSTRQMQLLTKGCPGIGMLDEIPVLNEGSIIMDSDHKILCFTDGVVELEKDGVPDFGQKVVEEFVSSDLDITDTVNNILSKLDIQKSNNTLFDDITLLGIDFFVK
ncbi:MAG: SpoIIE family protein phosphatase [Bacteroidales bacterium]|nr:SpoIIE family protein phosphatase [Bacteroidales bacterium]